LSRKTSITILEELDTIGGSLDEGSVTFVSRKTIQGAERRVLEIQILTTPRFGA
jgi:hypothetical protein